ncbi:response regulator transcription factor [Microvirga terrae]|uniref:Response regulator transcription factor n=1 Tax=Microvirga terrae TaxID=2740529 RepID=A0ABY5RME3_9HYPH|nr:response regulator transcription factor [Microvirga terrae]UVF18386.1 response regulator transcription factor [Microvirga terrae]
MSADRRLGLVADNDSYFRIAAAAILTRYFNFTEVAEASSLDEALEYLSENKQVESALFDLSMGGMRTLTNLRALRECFPATRVIVISTTNERKDILSALEAGVHGYVPKNLPVSEFVKALTVILDGGVYVPPCLADISTAAADTPPQPQMPVRLESTVHPSTVANSLTARQRDVLDLLVQGKSNKEIALALKLGEGTVKIHVAAIFRYFGVNNRAAAAVAGARPYPNRPRGVLPVGLSEEPLDSE